MMHARTILTVANFFTAVSGILLGFILISYLSSIIPTAYVGLVIAIGASIALAIFPFLPRLIERYGAQRLALAIACIEAIMLVAIAALPGTILSVVLIAFVISSHPLLYYELDLLLEATTGDGMAGRVRTTFITGGSVGALVAPLLIGPLLGTAENYVFLFLCSAGALIPFIILFTAGDLPRETIPSHSHVSDTLKHLSHNHDLAAVTVGHFILYLFYVWAPFYIPIYLHNELGLPWTTLGWIFSIMLLPFILIEYPAGWLADRVIGDKEMMTAGFLIMGLSLATISMLTRDSSIFFIVAILFITRIGAALVESMTEGHFFRRVSQKDIGSVSVFRGVWPLASVVAPLIASGILLFGNYQLLFAFSGAIILLGGVASSLRIKDFR